MRAVTKWLVLGEAASAQCVAVSVGDNRTFLPGQVLAMFRHHGRLPHQGNTTFYHIWPMLAHGNFACRLCHGTLLVIKMQPSQRAGEPLRQKESEHCRVHAVLGMPIALRASSWPSWGHSSLCYTGDGFDHHIGHLQPLSMTSESSNALSSGAEVL